MLAQLGDNSRSGCGASGGLGFVMEFLLLLWPRSRNLLKAALLTRQAHLTQCIVYTFPPPKRRQRNKKGRQSTLYGDLGPVPRVSAWGPLPPKGQGQKSTETPSSTPFPEGP